MFFHGNMILVHITVEAPQIFYYNTLLHFDIWRLRGLEDENVEIIG